MVQEHRGGYPSLWAAIESLAPKIGCVPQTLNEWVKRNRIFTTDRYPPFSPGLGVRDALPYPVISSVAGKARRNSMLWCAGATSQSSNCAGGRITTMRFSLVGL